MRTTINKGRVSYSPASLDDHTMEEAGPKPGFVSYPMLVEGPKLRERSPSFGDHYGQARLFWNSQTAVEKHHIIKALQFELSKVETRKVRVRMLGHLAQINDVLAAQVAQAIGESADFPPKGKTAKGTSDLPDEIAMLDSATTPTTAAGGLLQTKGLSMQVDQPKLPQGRKVAILVAPGVNSEEIKTMQSKFDANNILSEIVAPWIGEISANGDPVEATKTYANTSSVHFDAVFVPGGEGSINQLLEIPDAIQFIDEAYKHGKAIAASDGAVALINETKAGELAANDDAAQGILCGSVNSIAAGFIEAIAQHRFHQRSVDKIRA